MNLSCQLKNIVLRSVYVAGDNKDTLFNPINPNPSLLGTVDRLVEPHVGDKQNSTLLWFSCKNKANPFWDDCLWRKIYLFKYLCTINKTFNIADIVSQSIIAGNELEILVK